MAGPQIIEEYDRAYAREQALQKLEKASQRIGQTNVELLELYEVVKQNTEGWSDARTALAEAMRNIGMATSALEDEIRRLRAQRR